MAKTGVRIATNRPIIDASLGAVDDAAGEATASEGEDSLMTLLYVKYVISLMRTKASASFRCPTSWPNHGALG
jgi:hypothetical protein